MASYKIEEVTESYVYCVVTRDNGENFGQMVHGEASKTEAKLEGAIWEAVLRIELQDMPREQKVLDLAQARTEKQLIAKQAPIVELPVE